MLFLRGDSVSAARYAVFGTAYCIGLPARSPATLPLARAALHGFGRANPDKVRDSLPLEIIWLCADF
eukprot:6219361-Pyramimonas_sp.AAC.1